MMELNIDISIKVIFEEIEILVDVFSCDIKRGLIWRISLQNQIIDNWPFYLIFNPKYLLVYSSPRQHRGCFVLPCRCIKISHFPHKSSFWGINAHSWSNGGRRQFYLILPPVALKIITFWWPCGSKDIISRRVLLLIKAPDTSPRP